MKPPEAYEANHEEPTADVYAPVDSYPGGRYDIFFIHLYGDHVVRRVCEEEVYLFTFALHLLYTN